MENILGFVFGAGLLGFFIVAMVHQIIADGPEEDRTVRMTIAAGLVASLLLPLFLMLSGTE